MIQKYVSPERQSLREKFKYSTIQKNIRAQKCEYKYKSKIQIFYQFIHFLHPPSIFCNGKVVGPSSLFAPTKFHSAYLQKKCTKEV